MKERLSPDKEKTALQGSRSMEKAWRVWTFPRKYPLQDVEDSSRFLVFQQKNYQTLIELGGAGIDLDILDRVFMGIYHREITPPVELKYKNSSRN